MGEMDADSFVDYWLGQCFRMGKCSQSHNRYNTDSLDRPGRDWWTAGQSASHWCYFSDASGTSSTTRVVRTWLISLDIRIRTLAPIPDLHRLQRRRFHHQRAYELCTSAVYEECL